MAQQESLEEAGGKFGAQTMPIPEKKEKGKKGKKNGSVIWVVAGVLIILAVVIAIAVIAEREKAKKEVVPAPTTTTAPTATKAEVGAVSCTVGSLYLKVPPLDQVRLYMQIEGEYLPITCKGGLPTAEELLEQRLKSLEAKAKRAK